MVMNIKKTLGILLAFCFLISVTAAAVSAGPATAYDKSKMGENSHNQIGDKDQRDKDQRDKDQRDKDQRDKDKFKQSGHWEIIKVKHIVWNHGEKHVYFTFKKVFVFNHFNFR